MGQPEFSGRPTRAKGTMQEALKVLSGDRTERDDLVPRAERAVRRSASNTANGGEFVTDLGNAINEK